MFDTSLCQTTLNNKIIASLSATMEGVDEHLVKLHQRYIQETLGLKWMEEYMMRKWDT